MTTDPTLKVQLDHERLTIDIRQSAIQTYLNCQRRFYWEYVRGIEPDYPDGDPPVTNATVGSLVHVGVAAYYRDRDIDLEMLTALRDMRPYTWDELDAMKALDLATIMVDGYIEDVEYDGADVGEETVLVEAPVVAEFDLGSEWNARVHGTVDRVVWTEDYGHILEDTKTVGKLDSSLTYIQQLGRYAVMLDASTDFSVNRVRTNQIKRVKRTGEGPFYTRPWLPFSEEAMAVHRADLINTLRMIVDTMTMNTVGYTYNVTGECNWKCRVKDLCVGQMQGDDVSTQVEIYYREKA